MELILASAFAIASFTISILSFMEKGFLFNNAYLFASEQERGAMDKKPYYRQSAIVFCLLGMMFSLIAMAAFSGAGWLYYIACAAAFMTLAYAIASSVKDAIKETHERTDLQ